MDPQSTGSFGSSRRENTVGTEWRDLIGIGCHPDSSDHGKWPDEESSSHDFPSSDELKGLEEWNYGLTGIGCLSGTIRKTLFTESPSTNGIPLFLHPVFAGIQSIPITVYKYGQFRYMNLIQHIAKCRKNTPSLKSHCYFLPDQKVTKKSRL
jgi:hypothetical protein